MIDATLDRHLAEVKELQACWKQFKDFFMMALKREGLTPENEKAFLKVKSRIAMLHDAYLDLVQGDRKVAQNIILLVGRSITLKHVSQLSLAESKKVEIEWHETYLQIEETIGGLEMDRARLASITASQYRMNILRQRIRRAIRLTLHSTIFKLAVVAAVLLGIIVAMAVFNVGERLWINPSTRGLAVGLFAVIHIVQPDQEYLSIVDQNIPPLKLPRNKPVDFRNILKLTDTETNIKSAADQANWNLEGKSFNVAADLVQAKEFYAQQVLLERKAPIHIFYFRFEKTPQAKDIMDRLAAFNESLGKLRKADPAPNASLFRKANVIILIMSENFDARNWIRRQLFGVTLDTDV